MILLTVEDDTGVGLFLCEPDEIVVIRQYDQVLLGTPLEVDIIALTGFVTLYYSDDLEPVSTKCVYIGPLDVFVGEITPYIRVLTEAFVYKKYIVNSMGTISTRVPDDLEAELEAYLEDETLDRSTAVRKLLSEGLEDWRRERALDSLAAGEITFSKAAEHAGMSVWDFAQLAKERDITWVDGDHLEDDLGAL